MTPDIIEIIVYFQTLSETVKNYDMELEESLIHHDFDAHHFEIRERTSISQTVNVTNLFWKRKGLNTYTSSMSYLILL